MVEARTWDDGMAVFLPFRRLLALFSRKTYHIFWKMQAEIMPMEQKPRNKISRRDATVDDGQIGFLSKKTVPRLIFPGPGSIVIVNQWRDGRAAKATVCKTGSGGFNSHSRLQFAPSLRWQGFPLIFPAASFICVRS